MGRSQPWEYPGVNISGRREQQLESQKMGMNLTSSRHRKEASVSGVE